MSKTLVIVESPAKAKTISKYLGSEYIVKSSVGHIRDLPKGKTKKPSQRNTIPKDLPEDEKRRLKQINERKRLIRRMFSYKRSPFPFTIFRYKQQSQHLHNSVRWSRTEDSVQRTGHRMCVMWRSNSSMMWTIEYVMFTLYIHITHSLTSTFDNTTGWWCCNRVVWEC